MVLCGVRMKGVQAPLCVQDVKSRITRGVAVCVQDYLTVDVVCVNGWVCKERMLTGRHSWWSESCYNSLESKENFPISDTQSSHARDD